MNKKQVTLKQGREKALLNHHHWIFSGAIQNLPNLENGDILPVYSDNQTLLGHGYFNQEGSLIGRMISFGEEDPQQAIQNRIDSAITLRTSLFNHKITNAYRLINGEGDGLPGLIVDRYSDYLVIQSGTHGIDRLKPQLVETLVSRLKVKGVYEKSNLSSRKEEGLQSKEGWLFGTETNEIEIIENGIHFIVSPTEGQKTGFFLDQREMRLQIKELSLNKKVLNCFSYTGGFSLYAAKGGALQVDSIDISEKATALAQKNASTNNCEKEKMKFITADVFEFLRQNDLNYNLIILDPPAFAKKKNDVDQACRGYKDINRLALQKLPPKSLLLTCSCSYHIDNKLFQMVVFQAAVEAKRNVRIVGRHRLAPDHPTNLYHPETEYLKSLLLYVD